MPAQDWNYVDNQFDIITQHSRKRMNAVAVDHVARLGAVTGNVHIAALFNRTQPLLMTWADFYKVWLNTKVLHDGARATLENKRSELASVKIPQWESAVAMAYEPQTPRYLGIFPVGGESFGSGTADEQIEQLRALAQRVRNVGDLDSLAREIEAYGTELEGLLTVQQRLEFETGHAREALEPHRKQLATMLFRNLGALIEIYAEDPSQLASFFNFDLLHGVSDEDDTDADELHPQSNGPVTHMAPMVGGIAPPVAVTGRRGAPPSASSGLD